MTAIHTDGVTNQLMTRQEAQALRQRFVDLIEDRDKLRVEVGELRAILSELETLREFLHHEPDSPFMASAATNGHLSPIKDDTARVEQPVIPEDTGQAADDASYNPADNHTGDDDHSPSMTTNSPAPMDQTIPEDTGQAADDASPDALADGDRAGAPDTPALDEASPDDTDNGPVVDALDDDPADEDAGDVTPPPVPDADDAPSGERPAPGTLLSRILEVVERSTRPRRPWQIRQSLGLERLPSAELSELVKRGCLERLKDGIYSIPGRSYSVSTSSEGDTP